MDQIVEAFTTGAGMLWKALWALIFGYIISAGIQIFVTRDQMARVLGDRGARKPSIAGSFGFVSSSCSFAALAASRSILVKGAHPVNSIAFLISSTNLVIELGIVLLVLLGWKFMVANFLLGILMTIYAYALSLMWLPRSFVESEKEHAEKAQSDEGMDTDQTMKGSFRDKLLSREGWDRIARVFFMEWKMVWKEILFGFTVAGFISVFVPQSFWNAIFLVGDGAFLGADLVAATVIWVHAKYYGWQYALYLSGLLYLCMVAAGITVHYLFALVGMIPTERPSLQEMVRFSIDYTFFLNLIFLVIGAILIWLHLRNAKEN